jgi:pSer/pThr/pTyr-binding forkhead associated (FHA) protein
MKLIIEDEEGRRTTVPFVRDEVSIGRQEGNTARLTARNVSRRHALMIQQNGGVIIEDLNSYNGVRINGERINGRASVRRGDIIQIGDYDLQLASDEPEVAEGRGKTQPNIPPPEAPNTNGESARSGGLQSPGNGAARTVIPAPKPADSGETLRPADQPKLVLLNTPGVGREIVVDRPELRIGQGDASLLVDPQAFGKEDIRLRRDEQGLWRVVAVGSARGVKVNGERRTEAPLAPGDILQVGLVRMRFIAPGERFSLAGFSDDQRRLERPVQALFAVVAVLFMALLVYLVWMRPRQAVRQLAAEPSAQVDDPIRTGVHQPQAPAEVESPKAPLGPQAVESDPHHGKTAKAVRKHRGPDEAESGAGESDEQRVTHQARSAQLYEEGVALISDADYVAALAKLQKALDIDPSFAEAHKAMGVCYAHLQEADKGAFHYEQYLKLDPGAEDAPEVRRMLADYYRTRGGNPEPE